MKYLIQYVIDGVGYGQETTAKDEHEARATMIKQLTKAYPNSIVGRITVSAVKKA